jgi:hypothetical protein
MRCAHVLSIGLSLFAATAGCQNRNAPLTNPFLTPDRVPPPQTRVLTPGTAQPYYPGDPMPGSVPLNPTTGGFPAATAPPAGTFGPSTMPPASAYPGAAPYQSNPVTPTTPATQPGAWGGYGPRAENSAGGNLTAGDSVRVPTDQQQARFASVPVNASSTATAPHLRTPIQSLVPPTQDQLAAGTGEHSFTPNAGAQPAIQRAAYDETPPLAQSGAQRLQVREVTPAEYTAPTIARTSTPTRDGFRPQSGEPRAEVPTESPLAKGFRPPSGGATTVASGEAKFGVGPSQEWIRGQLEYWPTTGEWSIKYMPDGSVDQIGGRILIDNPQVLGHLPPGEFVMIEGQVFGRQIDDATYRPAYRVAVVQRQHK